MISTPRIAHTQYTRTLNSFTYQPKYKKTSLAAEVEMFHYPSIHSTQDQMKSILRDQSKHKPNSFVAITASEQTQGRGTNGRSWVGHLGNVFLTIAIPTSELDILPSLLPLQMGTIVTERIYQLIKDATDHDETLEENKLTIKWPNDVLLNERKIAGILIESDQDYENNYYYLVGIGINYIFAPEIETTGPHRGRIATCICDCIDCTNINGIEEAKELGIHIVHDIKDWVGAQKGWDGAAEAVVRNWERWAEFGQKLVLRDDTADTTVVPLGIENDGRLRVKGMDGKERLLCFDYLL
jgi:BirA family biotin operon repressor/biotin-[acetyl-CoA-carboxylase] ligase